MTAAHQIETQSYNLSITYARHSSDGKVLKTERKIVETTIQMPIYSAHQRNQHPHRLFVSRTLSTMPAHIAMKAEGFKIETYAGSFPA